MKLIRTCLLLFLFGFLLNIHAPAQEVTIFPGILGQEYYQDDIRIDKKEFVSLMNSNDLSKFYYEKSKRHLIYAISSGVVYSGFTLWQLYALDNGENIVIPLVGGLGSFIALVGFSYSSTSARKNAILSYNKGLDGGFSLNISPTSNGIGLVLSF